MRHPDLEPIVEPDRRIAIAGRSSDHYRPLHPDRAPVARSCTHHAFSWNLTSPFSKKPTIWFAAATPALLFASRVWAPIFFLGKITLFMYLSPTSALISSAFPGITSLREQSFVDGLFCLRCQGDMQGDILVLEEICNRVHGICSHLSYLLLGNVWIVSVQLHAETGGQFSNSTGDGTRTVECNRSTGELKTTGAIKIVSGTGQHHAKDKFCHCVGILARRIHGHHTLAGTCRQVNVVVACTSTHAYLERFCFFEHGSIHYVAANDHTIS